MSIEQEIASSSMEFQKRSVGIDIKTTQAHKQGKQRGKPGIIRDPQLIREVEAEIEVGRQLYLRELEARGFEVPDYLKNPKVRIR